LLKHKNSEPVRPRRVVVLGGYGFLGSHLVQELRSQGVESVAISRQDVDLAEPAVAERLAALLLPTDSVVMLAALKVGRRQDEDAYRLNICMAENVRGALVAKGCQHLIYLSSDAVYSYQSELISESSELAPSSLYAKMHLEREALFASIPDSTTCILRIAQVYGVGDPHEAYGPGRMIRTALRENRISLFGDGEDRRDHIHVSDVVSVICDVLALRSFGLANLATGQSHSFFWIANAISTLLPPQVSIEREKREQPLFHRSFDIAELKQAFPSFMPLKLEDGLAVMIEGERRLNVSKRAAVLP